MTTIDHRTRPDRNPGGTQRAGKADDIVGHLTGLRRKMIDGHRITIPVIPGRAKREPGIQRL